MVEGSTFQEEDGEFQHITPAIGYMVDFEDPITRGFVPNMRIGTAQ